MSDSGHPAYNQLRSASKVKYQEFFYWYKFSAGISPSVYYYTMLRCPDRFRTEAVPYNEFGVASVRRVQAAVIAHPLLLYCLFRMQWQHHLRF